MQNYFPENFTELERFSAWVLPDETARRNKCVNSSMEEIQEFYDSMLGAMETMLDYLNQYSLDDLDEQQNNLLLLSSSFVEAAISVEMFGQPEIDFGIPIERFRPLHHLVP